MPKTLKIYTDGGARGNPGPAAAGAVIMDQDNKIIATKKKYLGQATNNIAEYSAVLLGMETAATLGAHQLNFFLDSELAVKQLNREYKVKNENIGKLFVKIFNLSHKFKQVTYTHIPREMNKLADKLVNQALDENN